MKSLVDYEYFRTDLGVLYCGDCLEVLPLLEDGSVDLVITSPPYNLGSKPIHKNSYDVYKDNIEKDAYFLFVDKVINLLHKKTNYHIFFNIQEVHGNDGIIRNIYLHHYEKMKCVILWAKTNPPSHICDTHLSNGFEYIFCFSKEGRGGKFNHCNFSNRNGDCAKNVLINPVNSDNVGHSFAFPCWLPKHFIRYFSCDGDLILDPFLGSGTTAVACEQLQRRWIGIEISPEYCEIAKKRLLKWKGQQRLEKEWF